MPTTIEEFRITRIQYPRSRPIGDSQVYIDTHHIGILELIASDGQIGIGFFGALAFPQPDRAELTRAFGTEVFPNIAGRVPFTLTHQIGRPRGGNIRANPFGQAVDQALWDLQGKALGLPLYRLLGGTDGRVRAYASGLDFHMTDDEFQTFFVEAHARGFGAHKIKVGHPDLAWDLRRLKLLVEAVGPDATIMVDANEAWSPKEAIRRAHAYRDAGFNIYWIEDPCLRDDFAGLARVAQEVPFTHINSGEYLDLRGKRLLLEARAVDYLNVHGNISDTLRAAWLAAEYGLPVSLGNTPFEIGVHLAAALPEANWIEYSFQDYNQLVVEPVQFDGGYAIAPERPGHGLEISEVARAEYATPNL